MDVRSLNTVSLSREEFARLVDKPDNYLFFVYDTTVEDGREEILLSLYKGTYLVVGGIGAAGVKGEQGIQGIPGRDGKNATISIGKVQSIPSGQSARVENVGTATNAVLDFYIPVGEKGGNGSLGLEGQPGPKGEDGKAATINVGKVTAISSIERPTIKNVGTETDAVFDFGIPAGLPGKDGKDGADGKDGMSFIQKTVYLDDVESYIVDIDTEIENIDGNAYKWLLINNKNKEITVNFPLSATDIVPFVSTGLGVNQHAEIECYIYYESGSLYRFWQIHKSYEPQRPELLFYADLTKNDATSIDEEYYIDEVSGVKSKVGDYKWIEGRSQEKGLLLNALSGTRRPPILDWDLANTSFNEKLHALDAITIEFEAAVEQLGANNMGSEHRYCFPVFIDDKVRAEDNTNYDGFAIRLTHLQGDDADKESHHYVLIYTKNRTQRFRDGKLTEDIKNDQFERRLPYMTHVYSMKKYYTMGGTGKIWLRYIKVWGGAAPPQLLPKD